MFLDLLSFSSSVSFLGVVHEVVGSPINYQSLNFLSSIDIFLPSIVVEYDAREVINLINNCSSNFIEMKNAVDEISALPGVCELSLSLFILML